MIEAVLSLLLATPVLVAQEEMKRHLEAIQRQVEDDHLYLSDKNARALRETFARYPPEAPAILRLEGHLRVGEEEQHVGNELEAIRHFEEALALLPGVQSEMSSQAVGRLYFRAGLAYLRFGETQNCALRHAAESCILPIRGSGIHVDPQPSRKATVLFRKLLEVAPEDSEPYRTGTWLLNVAYMTVGGYPEEVPAEYRIPPESFASEVDFPAFPNVAHEAGVATFTLSGSVVVEDFDRDGYLDLLVSSYDPWEPLRLFVNDEGGGFVERTEEANLSETLGGLNMVQGDYDDDGDADVLLLRGAWLGRAGRHANSLLRNNGDGTFTDVTFETGLGKEHFPTQTASWADYDNDGDLDLYVGNETNEELTAPASLFRNDGGRFEDVAEEAGVTNLRFSKGVVFGDYDQDGFADIYVSNLDGDNRLYRNLGDGTFVDVAPELGVTGPKRSFPVWFWDFDNDGATDIFVSAYEALVEDLTTFHLTGTYEGEKPRLYRGDGKSGFTDVGLGMGLDEPSAPMGANFGDLDNDGYPDFYLGTGYPPYFALMPNVMYWNREGKRFDDVTTAGGFGHLQKGHGVAFADLDNDGDQDVFEQMGGALAGDKYKDVLYQNPGFGHHWLGVTLVGTHSNRSAIGARIRVVLSDRSVYRHVNSGGTFGAGSVERQGMGLGGAERVERVEILWPRSQRTQVLEDVPVDRRILVREGTEGFYVLP